jgi:hypothetical protein
MAAMIAEFVASFRYKASRTPIPLCQTMVGLLWPSRAERPLLARLFWVVDASARL